jgi:hypothetical protein
MNTRNGEFFMRFSVLNIVVKLLFEIIIEAIYKRGM